MIIWMIWILYPCMVSSLTTSSSKSRDQNHLRTFQFVKYGQSVVQQGKNNINGNDDNTNIIIACDGRVPGATMEVSHWNENDTPDSIYADTSTEMAIIYLKQQQYQPDWTTKSIVVVNNHYDTDGVASVYALVGNPTVVLQYENLLIQAAESGDFEEWNSDQGLKLDLTLCNMCSRNENDNNEDEGQQRAYTKALIEMPTLLKDMAENKGVSYRHFWHEDYALICQDWERIQSGNVRLDPLPVYPRMVLVYEATPTSRVSPYALSRGLKERGLWEGTTRILRVNTIKDDHDGNDHSYRYTYEKIGHGWIHKLVQRHVVPVVDDAALVDKLNDDHVLGNQWTKGGPGQLIAICQTNDAISSTPHEVAHKLVTLDDGCLSS
jgi:hypothetical protein